MTIVKKPNIYLTLGILILITVAFLSIAIEINTVVLLTIIFFSIVLMTVSNQVNEGNSIFLNLLEIAINLILLALILILGEQLMTRILLIGLFVLNIYIFRKL
ncbi:hypothetical protein [Alkalibacillus haloalkaliphilus]|uniref:Uncharacterized protein n=1 Tax=Alkalibacillus haloalkaliphilus TaxID=94136 RepID=A0A511W529_9BACI|nr:hypothetical protein [Alkalibacillus haloalkaliphilus]GEN46185.1 hypothetical protein AHA02nite_19610 [Alkalibacillus haloalkaliphilus]